MTLDQTGNKVRIDKWLWYARFYKTRSLASKACQSGHIVLNGQSVSKASVTVVVGDRLQFFQGPHLRVIEVVAPGERRGPAPEAQQLYIDHSPPRVAKKEVASDIRTAPIAEREAGSGRPTKAERRATDRLRGDE
ncbi:RNA-binding S4 domain-containing protein [Thalassospira sp. MCCC 1A03138]|uniref:RNA-binding S4 domain-containing protein n=1 Tax=Thalassospira sp. MCCC 1A03138 TaxID=1470576 RepID=UPI000A1F40D4|nr:RNA-binding S4 domain-containing protein [Thalassospira sp. MCCC 1A03138]OSQ32544.1 tRNA synthetase RNA-binding protein [Thalassospira sp. MCCC 1A03138]